MGERRSAIIIGISIALAVSLILAWALAPSANDIPPLTEVTDKGAIQNLVQLSRVSIATSENYVGHRLRLVSAQLKNISPDKPLRQIDVKMTFTDTAGNPIHEYTGVAFEPRRRPLEPGTEFRFDFSFENLPRNWNYRIPIAEVTKVAY
jgi:hypothetical protein